MLKNLQSNVDEFGFSVSIAVRRVCGSPAVVPWLRASAAALTGALLSAPVAAQLPDTVRPFVSVGVTRDDNLFRLSEEDQAAVAYAADTSRNAMAGIEVELPLGRQVFSTTAKVSRVTFEHNDQFNYTGKDIKGDLRWMVGNHLDGRVGGAYEQVLAPFSDYHNTGERNLRTVRRQFIEGKWRFHPSWRVRAGYNEDRFNYELTTQRFNERTEKAVMAGADYLATSGSTIGLQFRRLKTNYPFQDSLGLTQNGYTQDEQKINILWLATGTTQVTFLGGLVQRKHPFYTERDDSGTNGRLIVSSSPDPRLQLTGQLYREYGSAEGALINSALIKGAQLNANWELTAKIQATANLKHEEREFSPFTDAGLALPRSQLTDRNNLLTAGLTYSPLRNISLQLSVFQDRRSGSVAAGTNTYKAKGASFNATVQF
jgi:exopolysaccharide biosynthesis operon protein EpsL